MVHNAKKPAASGLFPLTGSKNSERDVVLEIVELAARRLRRGLPGRGARRTRLALAAFALRSRPATHSLARAEHLHGVRDDFGRVLVDAVLVLPLARLEAPFHVDLRALLEVLARDLGELAEEGDAMPFGLLLLLAVLVLPHVRGRDRDVGDRAAVGHVARFRIAAEVADDDHLVDRCHTPFLS